MKYNETKRKMKKQTKRNEVSQNETKKEETKWRNETKRNKVSQNETKFIKQSIKDPKTINEGIKINEILSGLFGYL